MPEDKPRVWRSRCVRCRGYDSGCERCGGSGEVDHRRCPNAMARGPWVIAFLRAHSVLRAYNAWPEPGTWLDQSAAFLDLIPVVDEERAQLEKEQRGG